MKVSIINERHNPFLKRKELLVHIEHESEATPRKDALQQYLAKELGTEAEKIEVKNIFTGAGLPKSQARVFAWEEKVVKQEKKKEEKAETGQKAAEEAKEEKPKE